MPALLWRSGVIDSRERHCTGQPLANSHEVPALRRSLLLIPAGLRIGPRDPGRLLAGLGRRSRHGESAGHGARTSRADGHAPPLHDPIVDGAGECRHSTAGRLWYNHLFGGQPCTGLLGFCASSDYGCAAARGKHAGTTARDQHDDDPCRRVFGDSSHRCHRGRGLRGGLVQLLTDECLLCLCYWLCCTTVTNNVNLDESLAKCLGSVFVFTLSARFPCLASIVWNEVVTCIPLSLPLSGPQGYPLSKEVRL
mmetsp:Transcript_21952/g.51349  ORF Transcript_21952/g.51349 Transcript_21952/m.51349 type:complete len:252 (-) Transcript_21952:152-907(-)